MPPDYVQYHRFKVQLTPDQARLVGFYLTRSTLFWNYLTQRLKKDARDYLEAPDSVSVDEAFMEKLAAEYEAVTKTADLSHVDEAWSSFMPKIRELPEAILLRRFVDMANCYALAKKDLLAGTKKPTGLPRRKNATRSSQSVQFGPDEYLVEAGKVYIQSVVPIALSVPELLQTPLDLKEHTLTLTKRSSAQKDGLGPNTEDEYSYVITFKPV